MSLQRVTTHKELPKSADFRAWINVAMIVANYQFASEVLIRIVDDEESQSLNGQYRGKDYATNVLSFPSELPHEIAAAMTRAPLGDIIICAPVVMAEAKEQEKSLQSHWAHLTIHGVLHLLGYDHIDDDEAEQMEALEVQAMALLGYSNPYTCDAA
ncbi:putative rRNA maturation factor [Agitococcus lubricus]|uniref:Endoribonuclease YbeY n=1 Tax=Agitococcus lubricus TaxID=1077255 RepID=A0A2T5J1V7_9GAMM|nr:putative rRNA maturation factor [Agitococcus lubricus]